MTPARAAMSFMVTAIRRTIPMTNSIRRAFEAGTRDATGRPGPNYWQLETDFTIRVRLDPVITSYSIHYTKLYEDWPLTKSISGIS